LAPSVQKRAGLRRDEPAGSPPAIRLRAVDRLKQLREPAAVLVLVALALQVALTILGYALLTREFGDMPLGDLAFNLASPGLIGLLAILVITCWFGDPTPRARRVTVLALALTAALLVGALGLFVASLVWRSAAGQASLALTLRGLVLWLTTTVIAVGVFVALLRRPSTAATPAVDDGAETEESTEPVPAPTADPQLQPGWSPDAAVGAVWRRAGDAAAGAPAAGLDAMAQATGRWGPTPPEETPGDQPREASSAPEWPDVRGDWSSPGRG
jgi:hypothetical protein